VLDVVVVTEAYLALHPQLGVDGGGMTDIHNDGA
jgi:hypothetical protein